MDLKQVQHEIISCFWSEGQKRAIRERDYSFQEEELLGLAYRYAPSFAERLRLLRLLADHVPAVSARAARCIVWEKKNLDCFRTHGDREVYELRIKDTPDAYEERYLCESFEAALEMIDGYYQMYDFAPETEQARYVIAKRKILQSGQPFDEDGLGECCLSAGKVLVSVDGPRGESENGPCSDSCEECKNRCSSNIAVYLPVFVPHLAPVRYRLPHGEIQYGIHLDFQLCDTMESYYVIPLDGQLLEGRAYSEQWGFHWHEHIPGPELDVVPLEELGGELRENYHAFVAWVREKWKQD